MLGNKELNTGSQPSALASASTPATATTSSPTTMSSPLSSLVSSPATITAPAPTITTHAPAITASTPALAPLSISASSVGRDQGAVASKSASNSKKRAGESIPSSDGKKQKSREATNNEKRVSALDEK
jgi:hypothetical protein